jgi:uncharacterized membrane protein YeaQ/YmgE (transglycosylase-associated protein family)
VILLFFLAWGMAIGWIAWLVVRGFDAPVHWGMALAAGIGGSFVGGLLASLISGDGIEFRASGIIGSIIGAIIILAIVGMVQRRVASQS